MQPPYFLGPGFPPSENEGLQTKETYCVSRLRASLNISHGEGNKAAALEAKVQNEM